MKELIKTLVESYGPSGYEEQVREIIENLAREKADDIRTDALGNLIVLKKGTGGGKRVMVAAHMDEIGVMVHYVDSNGFLRFGTIGGVSPRTVVGARVRFADGTIGVIGLEKWLQTSDQPTWDRLFIDVGATSPQDSPIKVGDAAVFVQPFVDMGNRMVAKSMDDRVGCAIALQTLLEMDASPNDVYFVFTSQEEVGTRGAAVSSFGIDPDVAIAIDVTPTADTPEGRPMPVVLGKGPAVKVKDYGMLAHPAVKDWMMETAENAGIPYQIEVLELGSTDARAMQVSRAGMPAGCLSVPCRYVHTPSEMVEYEDVLNSVRLLRAMLSNEITL
ncbi:MAG TPA: M42 family metallopeptidase [Chloroflexi bacterium]|nr:M42 family metallopeptidase [Chloroflexota bacterium]